MSPGTVESLTQPQVQAQRIRPHTGAKISTPGLYEGVPFDLYHGDLCDSLSVSASTLVTLAGTCPARAWAHHYANPDHVPNEDTEATDFGSAAHAFIVEGEKAFYDRYAVKPPGLNLATSQGRLWKAAHGGQEAVSADNFEHIQGMREALMRHPHARMAFRLGRPEISVAARDAETGLWLKARPDYWRLGLAINYKTTRTGNREQWRRQARALRYHASAAFCVDLLAALDEPANYAFVVQEKTPPYLVAVRVLTDQSLDAGRAIYRNALQRFAECFRANDWPGYPDIENVDMEERT